MSIHHKFLKSFNKFVPVVPAILQVCFLASSIKKAVTKIISAMNAISSHLASVKKATKKAVKKIMGAINNYGDGHATCDGSTLQKTPILCKDTKILPCSDVDKGTAY